MSIKNLAPKAAGGLLAAALIVTALAGAAPAGAASCNDCPYPRNVFANPADPDATPMEPDATPPAPDVFAVVTGFDGVIVDH